MASGFLAAAAGFGSGLSQGIGQGYEMQYRNQVMQLEKQRANLESISAMSGAMKITDPALRTLAVKKIMPSFGMDPNSGDGKDFLTMVNKSATDTLNWMSDSLTKMGMKMPPGAIGQAWQNDPAGFMTMLFNMRKLGIASNIAASGTGGDQGSTDITGGSTPPAGGVAAMTAPSSDVSQNGTTTGDTTQQMPVGPDGVARPYAQPPSNTNAQPVVQPTQQPAQQPVVDPNHPLLQAAGMPAATKTTGQQGAPAGMPIKDNPQMMWDVRNDPYVQQMTKKIMAERSLGDAGSGFADTLQKQVDQYIENKNQNISNYIRGQELQISKGQLSISAANLDLARKRLQWDIMAPKSPLGQLQYDSVNGWITGGGQPAPGSPAASAVQPPASGQPQASTGGTTQPNITPSGVAIADTAPAGAIDIKNTALLNQLGVKQGERAVVDNKGNVTIIRPTSTSLEQPAGQDEAKRSLSNVNIALGYIDTLMKTDPSNLGTPGVIKQFVQGLGSNITDVVQLTPGLKEALGPNLVKQLPKGFLDPALPKNEFMEHFVASILAKEMMPPGVMGGYSEVLKNAQEMMNITDIGVGHSSEAAIDRLQQAKDLLTKQSQVYQSQLDQGTTAINPQGSGGQNPNVPVPTPDDIGYLKANPSMAPRFDKAFGSQQNPNPSKAILGQ